MGLKVAKVGGNHGAIRWVDEARRKAWIVCSSREEVRRIAGRSIINAVGLEING